MICSLHNKTYITLQCTVWPISLDKGVISPNLIYNIHLIKLHVKYALSTREKRKYPQYSWSKVSFSSTELSPRCVCLNSAYKLMNSVRLASKNTREIICLCPPRLEKKTQCKGLDLNWVSLIQNICTGGHTKATSPPYVHAATSGEMGRPYFLQIHGWDHPDSKPQSFWRRFKIFMVNPEGLRQLGCTDSHGSECTWGCLGEGKSDG